MTIGLASQTQVIRRTRLPSGLAIPALGQGTWGMAEDARRRKEEAAALRLGLDLGMRLIDIVEMYADGGAEMLVGEAIAGRRDEVFLISKVLAENATRSGTVAACERGLQRLGTGRLDLYLPALAQQCAARGNARRLCRAGRCRQDSVLVRRQFRRGGHDRAAGPHQRRRRRGGEVLYNLTRRGIEYGLLPWCRKRGIPIIAYSPVEQGLLAHRELKSVAARHNARPARVVLAWLLRQDGVVAVPEAANVAQVRDNRAALELRLTRQDFAAVDCAFPAPTEATPRAML